MDVVLLLLVLVLNIAVPWLVVRLDMRYLLTSEQLDRSWNDASFWSAIVAFGPLALPFHFIKSRRSLLGVALGLLALAGSYIVIWLVLLAASSLVQTFTDATDF